MPRSVVDRSSRKDDPCRYYFSQAVLYGDTFPIIAGSSCSICSLAPYASRVHFKAWMMLGCAVS